MQVLTGTQLAAMHQSLPPLHPTKTYSISHRQQLTFAAAPAPAPITSIPTPSPTPALAALHTQPPLINHIVSLPSAPAAQLLPVSLISFLSPSINLLNIICRPLPSPLLLFLLLLALDLALLLALSLSLFPSLPLPLPLPLPLFLPLLLNKCRF